MICKVFLNWARPLCRKREQRGAETNKDERKQVKKRAQRERGSERSPLRKKGRAGKGCEEANKGIQL